jgi:hypothetical protein
MRLGLSATPWRFERILARRLFPARETASATALRIYRKLWTRSLPPLNRRHAG